MATIVIPTASRNAMADALVDKHEDGVGVSVFVAMTAGDADIVSIPLPDPAFGNSAAGVATLLGVPLNAAATAAGTVTKFEMRDSDANVLWGGDLTATGGGGTATIDNVVIADTQTVNLTGCTFTQPGS